MFLYYINVSVFQQWKCQGIKHWLCLCVNTRNSGQMHLFISKTVVSFYLVDCMCMRV